MAESTRNPKKKYFKYKELKVYTSTEWLADNKKKYRQVFNRYSTTYVYAELSFFNKQFDENDWEIEVELKCFALNKGRQEICSLPFKRKVSKYDSVVYIREGWGSKTEGSFWKRGTYYWEAWIEGEKVATKYFYVEDAGEESSSQENPFMEVQSLNLYEGPYDDVIDEGRIYYKNFSSEETRYIYAEVVFKNKFKVRDWQCEIFAKFYNNSKELKGQVIRLQRIEPNKDLIKVTAGWGSNVKGSWRKDLYTVELVFMDKLLAAIPFTVGDEFDEGSNDVFIPNQDSLYHKTTETELDLSFDELLSKLNALIGLTKIKRKVKDHAQYIKFLQLRKEKGFEEREPINVHSVFIGNPGTGKTTVAQMMGKLYLKMGLLSKGHVHEVDRVDLVGEYIGQTAPKVKEAIEKARGGVLFIDEAYSLARSNDDTKDFGREVIEILVKELSNGPGNLAVIVAGYPQEMEHFLNSNPGLKSRFKLFFEFDDYLPQQLIEISEYACGEKEVSLTAGARKILNRMITDEFRKRDRSFGNARYVFDIIEKSKIQMGIRLMESEKVEEMGKRDLSLIIKEDVKNLEDSKNNILPDIEIDEPQLKSSLKELDGLIGMDSIKTEIRDMVRLVKYFKYSGKDVLNNFFLHTVFVGNPGTGKTTVARILTNIYRALGILERGLMIETDRQGLVAGYVGQTAIKTSKKIDEAEGGVLFIDEAYALTSGGKSSMGDFGDEAIQTLLKRMEDDRGKFFVFVAGYPENMNNFLKANPGLKSRFDKTLTFEDYSPDELFEIAQFMLKEKGLNLKANVQPVIQGYLQKLYDQRDKYFGNARTVRKVVDELVRIYNMRLAYMIENGKEVGAREGITVEDLKQLISSKETEIYKPKGIGFRKR
ncbi:MAG: AAA family ATPase [Saprospiraceae bacterium]|nr:AAA family ATPase [Saprospiraceae bacterium]